MKITFPELRDAVVNNEKKRFSMIPAAPQDQSKSEGDATQQEDLANETLETITESDNPADYLIRANQGHSITVDTDGLLTPITKDAGNIPATVVHGTDDRAWPLILKSGGLRRMTRTHIHFAPGLPAGFTSLEENIDAASVVSGMRASSTVLIYIDVDAALEQGIPFFVSENGVVLSPGDEGGVLPYTFFKRVERRGGEVVMRDGVLPEGVVVDVEAWERDVKNSGGRGRGRGRGGRPRAADDSRDLMAGAE